MASSVSGDHIEFEVGAFDPAANRVNQAGWSIFLLRCHPQAQVMCGRSLESRLTTVSIGEEELNIYSRGGSP